MIMLITAFVIGTFLGSIWDDAYNGDMMNDVPSTLGGFVAFVIAMILSVLFHTDDHIGVYDLHVS